MYLNHIQIQVRKVSAEARRSLDGDVAGAIVRDLEASRNRIVPRED